MSIKQNNASIATTCTQRVIALKKHVKARTQMSIDGQPVKVESLIGLYQTCIDTRAALVAKRAELDKALTARDSAEAARLANEEGLKAWVATQFGARSQQAAEFGFSTPKIGAKTAETKFKGVLLSQATRKARGTMGKRQKEKIKGTLVVSAAPAVPAITAPAAAPAASALTATNGAPSGASSSNGAAASHS